MSTRVEQDRSKKRHRKPNEEEVQQAASRAEGTTEGEQFLKLCIDRLKILLGAVSKGVRPYNRTVDQTASTEDRGFFGVQLPPRRVHAIEDSWKYFKAEVHDNGSLENRHIWCSSPDGQDLDYPAYNGLVLVIESRADWVEKALCQWLEEERGLQRTTYIKVSTHGMAYYQTCIVNLPMPDALAFALPTRSRS